MVALRRVDCFYLRAINKGLILGRTKYNTEWKPVCAHNFLKMFEKPHTNCHLLNINVHAKGMGAVSLYRAAHFVKVHYALKGQLTKE